jgi:hypothetical protein
MRMFVLAAVGAAAALTATPAAAQHYGYGHRVHQRLVICQPPQVAPAKVSEVVAPAPEAFAAPAPPTSATAAPAPVTTETPRAQQLR